MVITLSFLIITILLFINLSFIVIKTKDKNINVIAWIVSFFTWATDGYYIIYELEGEYSVLMLYALMVGVVAVVSFVLKGLEK